MEICCVLLKKAEGQQGTKNTGKTGRAQHMAGKEVEKAESGLSLMSLRGL